MLGRAVYKQLTENTGYTVIGLGFSRVNAPLLKLNLRDKDDLTAFMKKENPDYIIHCAAERRPDVSEADPAASEQLNVEVTENIAKLSKQIGSFMLYISTDYVFDGKNPPYSIDSEPNPLNFYGKTKLAGEEAVKKNLDNYTILRVPILYGTELYPLESSISSIAAGLAKNRSGKFDDTATRYPTHTEDVAFVLDKLISSRQEGGDIQGIFHFSSNEALTKYKIAGIMSSFFNINLNDIFPDRTVSVSTVRPENSHLDTGRLNLLMKVPKRPFHKGITPVLERLFGKSGSDS